MSEIARRPRKKPSIARRWLPEHERVLGELLGTMDTIEIAAELTRRFGYPRTNDAVRVRISVLGLSRLTVRPWSQLEVARILGIGYERIRGWVRCGWLTGTPWRLGGGQRRDNVSAAFTRADIERFFREHPGMVQPQQIQDSGLRTLAIGLGRRQEAIA